ncbi:MAG: CcoQ/FixQ family Cbb3-type cytochrome c oxidase assembly chaperone, partial [Bacteroidia bacterium]|nr:CcoQ/FixQ family Cbb3-type cytochrome c oxidase assembly chaperone [Bacteroidia bacterium]
MKFINYLETITGVAIYPLISLFLFVIFFIAVTLYAFKLDKKYISKLENIPLG